MMPTSVTLMQPVTTYLVHTNVDAKMGMSVTDITVKLKISVQ